MKEMSKVQPDKKELELGETEERKPKENTRQEQVKQGKEDIKDTEQSETERQESLDETRRKIEEMPEKQPNSGEADEQKKEQRDFGDLFEQVKGEKGGVEKAIKLSPVGIVTEGISNTGKSQEIRDKTAERKVSEIIKALEDVYGKLEDIKGDVKTIMDLGAGWGENLEDLVKILEAEEAIGVDPKTIFSKKVDKEIGDKLGWMRRDALEAMELLKGKSIDLTTAFAFLQVLDNETKVEVLKEMGRVAKKGIVIVDELKRDGFVDSTKDWFLNKFYNAGMGKFNVLKEEEWKDIFDKAGLVVEAFNKFGNNDFVAVLKGVEEIKEVE